jgi:DNA-binding CsgD family transcriptional regulator
MRRPSEKPPTPDPLTEREIEVLKLLARGTSTQQIADQLSIAEVTVRSHVSNILSKLHLANRVQATLYALREGLISLDNGADAPDTYGVPSKQASCRQPVSEEKHQESEFASPEISMLVPQRML